MPKKNPKHQAQLQRQQALTKRGKRIYNWNKIALISVICGAAGVIIVLGSIFGPQLLGRTVQAGDTVFIYYELRLEDGTVKDKSATAAGTSFTMKTGPGGVIAGFYENVIGMREGTSKSFTIPSCPTQDCPDYKGYTNLGDPTLDWQQLNFNVKIVRFP